MNEITLKLESRIVEGGQLINARFKYVVGDPIFGMPKSVYKWYIRKHKNYNFVKRLKIRSL